MAGGWGLTAAQLLGIVDAGAGADAAQRGAIMAAVAVGEPGGERLDALSLGQRDAWILDLRCATFGDALAARVRCPNCGLRLSVSIPRGHVTLQAPSAELQPAPTIALHDGPIAIEARCPDGAALATAAACTDVAAARDSLILSCVLSATRDGEPVDPLELDEMLLERLGEAMLAADPQIEVRVGMTCAGCGREWSPVLDIVQFLWRELSTLGVQLLDEVHRLAVGYGWSEEQVLELPSTRRRQYVERLAGG